MAVRDRRKFIGPDETRAGASHRILTNAEKVKVHRVTAGIWMRVY